MSVAAVILAARPELATADADGVAAVRRIADVAGAGGAMPIVAVSADPDGLVAAALAGASVRLAQPPALEGGALAYLRWGLEVAQATKRGTTAALVWPVRRTWVRAGTVASLVEAHGARPGVLLRPAYRGEAGWPVLVPTELVPRLAPLAPGSDPDPVLIDISTSGLAVEAIELGDPGAVLDRSTPRSSLPPYEVTTRRR